jgi:L-amino acid N-acyltransferase YncA
MLRISSPSFTYSNSAVMIQRIDVSPEEFGELRKPAWSIGALNVEPDSVLAGRSGSGLPHLKRELHCVVRDSRDEDMPRIQTIYGFHVLHGLASFEEEPPSVDELSRRRADVLDRGLPYLVAETGGVVVGYSYAAPYRSRPAYRFTVENSVYVDHNLRRRGAGYALLSVLIARCVERECRQMIAVIGDSENVASIALHERLGFIRIGTLRKVGFKFGHWVDSVLMQRPLGPDEPVAVERDQPVAAWSSGAQPGA